MEYCHACAVQFFWFVKNTTAYHFGWYSLHLLLLKSSMWWCLVGKFRSYLPWKWICLWDLPQPASHRSRSWWCPSWSMSSGFLQDEHVRSEQPLVSASNHPAEINDVKLDYALPSLNSGNRYYTSSVTKWPDHLFNIWPLTTMKFCPIT